MLHVLTPAEWEAVELSLRVGLWSTLLSVPPGFALAYLLARGRFPGKVALDGLVHLPLVLPPVVTGYLLLLAFGRNGPLGQLLDHVFGVTIAFRWTGAVVASAVMSLPLLIRPMRLSIEAVDRKLEATARTLGASRWDAFLSVTLPLSMPGVLAGAVLGFARGLGEFGATITFVSNIPGETRTLPLAIYTLLQVPGGEGQVLRLSVLAIVLAFVALIAAELLARNLARRLQG